MNRQTPPHRLCSQIQNASRTFLARSALPYTDSALAITSILLRHGLITSLSLGSSLEAVPSKFPSLPLPERRIWVGHKYRNGLPVLRHMELVSKSSQRIVVTRDQLGLILTGKRAQNTGGIGMGEILIIKTDKDTATGRVGRNCYMDGWEAWRAGLGGEVVCRVS